MLRRTVIAALQPLVADRVYTVRQGLARGLRRRGGLGFIPRLGATPREERFLETLDLDGLVVYDVGGSEGIFTLFFLRRVGPRGYVVTFEPNPKSHAHIAENVRLNGYANVTLCAQALGREAGRAQLVFPTDERARGSLLPAIQQQIRDEPSVQAVDVVIETLDHFVASGGPAPDFVKLDVEGLELDVLQGMSALLRDHRPQLYIELHGADRAGKLANAGRVIDLLWQARYRIHHVETGQSITMPDHVPSTIEGHLHCVHQEAHG